MGWRVETRSHRVRPLPGVMPRRPQGLGRPHEHALLVQQSDDDCGHGTGPVPARFDGHRCRSQTWRSPTGPRGGRPHRNSGPRRVALERTPTPKFEHVRYSKLGTTGLEVSGLTLGCMSFGERQPGHQQAGPGERRQLLDTANGYSAGSSEEFVGQAVKDFTRREEVVLSTKVWMRMRPGPGRRGLSHAQPAVASPIVGSPSLPNWPTRSPRWTSNLTRTRRRTWRSPTTARGRLPGGVLLQVTPQSGLPAGRATADRRPVLGLGLPCGRPGGTCGRSRDTHRSVRSRPFTSGH